MILLGRTLPTRQSHTLLRPSFRSGATTPSYNRQYSAGSSLSTYNSLAKRHNIDYASDTEASYPTAPKSSSHYYYRPPNAQAISGMIFLDMV